MNSWQKPPWISTFILLYHTDMIKYEIYSYNDMSIYMAFFVLYFIVVIQSFNKCHYGTRVSLPKFSSLYTPTDSFYSLYLSKCKQVSALNLKWRDLCSSSLCRISNPVLICILWKIKLYKDVLHKPTSQRECPCVELW